MKKEDQSLHQEIESLQQELAESRKCVYDWEQKYQVLNGKDQFNDYILNSIQGGISVIDLNFRITNVNAWMETTYADHMPLNGKKCYQAFQGRDSICPWCPSEKALLDGKMHQALVPFPNETKPEGWIELSSTPFSDKTGEIVGVVEHVKDVSKQKLAEEDLTVTREKYQRLVEKSPYITYQFSLNKGGFYASARMKEILGFDENHIANDPLLWTNSIHPDDLPHIKTVISELKDGDDFNLEYRITDINGDLHWFRDRSISVYQDNKDIIIEGIAQDITELKKHQESLLEKQKNIQDIIENSPDGIIIADKDGKHRYANKRMSKILKCSRKEVLDITLNDITPEEDAQKYSDRYKRRIKGEKVKNNYTRNIIDRKGKITPVELRTTTTVWENERCGLAFITDISDRVEAEERLKRSEQRFRSLFDDLGDAVFVTRVGGSNSGQIIEVNAAATKQTGYNREELLKMNVCKDLCVFGCIEKRTRKLEKHLFNGKDLTITELKKRKNGEEYWTEVKVTPIEYNGETASLSINHDISERIRAEQVQKVLYNISTAIINTDDIDKLAEIIRVELGTIVETNNFYIGLIDPETNLIELPYLVSEKKHYTKFPTTKTLSNYVIQTRKPLLVNHKDILRLKEEGKVESVWAETKIWLGVPIKVDHSIIGVMAIQSFTDDKAYYQSDLKVMEIVARNIGVAIQHKEADENLKIALKKAEESDRLKSAFLATMSHELRTPLNAIIGFSDLLLDNEISLDEGNMFIKTISDNGNHLLSIVEDLFDLSIIEAGQTKIMNEEVNLQMFMNGLHDIVKVEQYKMQKEHLKIQTHFSKKALALNFVTDPLRLKQVLINVLKNAIKFTKEGCIKYGCKVNSKNGQERLCFYVKDTGIGIAEKHEEIIFEHFRQISDSYTKEFEGTGIGLSISKKLILLLGGDIWFESELGKGSTFYIEIPLLMTD